MPFIVTLNSWAHVDVLIILGLGHDKYDVMEPLFNFFKHEISISFEEVFNDWDIKIYNLPEKDLVYLQSLWNKYKVLPPARSAEEALENQDKEDAYFGGLMIHVDDDSTLTLGEKETVLSMITTWTLLL